MRENPVFSNPCGGAMNKYLKKMILKIHKKVTLLVVPSDGAAVKTFQISFLLFVVFIAVIFINIYFVYSYSVQNKRITQYEKLLSQKNLQISNLKSERSKLKPTLDKTYQLAAELNKLKQQRLKIIESWNKIQKSKTIKNPVTRSRMVGREPEYQLPQLAQSLAQTNLELLEVNNVELKRDLVTEKLKQERLLTELLKYQKKLDHIPSVSPLRFSRITSWFGVRIHPKLGFSRIHTGIDLGARNGTKVYATAAGRVLFAGYQSGYGNLVILDHGYGYQTYYGHNSRFLVKRNDKIKKGQVICLSGNTGVSTGPHLHYEVRVNGKPVNPILFMKN
jgi:murein DD-endopeptidase MepM/ murein hydrolase activator NlpD